MTQGVAMGYASSIEGWYEESTFANDSYVTLDIAGTPKTFNAFPKIEDFSWEPSVTRGEIYGVDSQVRTNDPILTHSFKLKINFLFQENGGTNDAYSFLNSVISNTGDSRKSYLIKMRAKPGGSTSEYCYLLGCTVDSITLNFASEDTIRVSIEFDVADYDDGGAAPTRNWSTNDIGVDGTAVTTDPLTFADTTITWSLGLNIASLLQDLSVTVSYNPVLIKTYGNYSHVNQAQGKIEVSFNGSAYGDDTLLGVSGLETADLLGDNSGNIAIAITNGTNTTTFTLTSCSYDTFTVPIKEASLIVCDFDGKANTITIANT